MGILAFAISHLGQGSNPVPSSPFYSMLSAHSTTWPLGRMWNIVLELPYTLQAKGLNISCQKRVVMQGIRSCIPRMSSSKVAHFASELSRQTSRTFSYVEVMIRSLTAYLVKRDFQSRIRSCDLGGRSPERSLGAIMAGGCRLLLGDLVFTQLDGLELSLRY